MEGCMAEKRVAKGSDLTGDSWQKMKGIKWGKQYE
jgi:hypothetical protein